MFSRQSFPKGTAWVKHLINKHQSHSDECHSFPTGIFFPQETLGIPQGGYGNYEQDLLVGEQSNQQRQRVVIPVSYLSKILTQLFL